MSSVNAIRKEQGFYVDSFYGRVCGSFLRKGVVLAYVWLFQNLKDLKDLKEHTVA